MVSPRAVRIGRSAASGSVDSVEHSFDDDGLARSRRVVSVPLDGLILEGALRRTAVDGSVKPLVSVVGGVCVTHRLETWREGDWSAGLARRWTAATALDAERVEAEVGATRPGRAYAAYRGEGEPALDDALQARRMAGRAGAG